MPGHLEKRGDNWRLVASAGKTGGKRNQPKQTFHGTEKEARRALARYVTEVQDGKATASARMTLADWAGRWLKIIGQTVAPRTLETYRAHLEHRIIPALGHIPLDKLNPRHIVDFLDQLAQDDIRRDGRGSRISAATQVRHFGTLRALLQAAVRRQYIALNPAVQAGAPRAERHEAPHYDDADLRRTFALLADEPPWFRALVILAATTALRRGELVGLEWRHVDLAKHLLTVEQSAQVLGGEQTVKGTKTGHRRVVALPEVAVNALREWQDCQAVMRLALGEEWTAADFIFTTEDGRWLGADRATKTWHAFTERHGLPPLTLHGLRHSAVTLWLERGVSIADVAGIAGHSTPTTTLGQYSHAGREGPRHAAGIMDDLFPSAFPNGNTPAPDERNGDGVLPS